MIHNNRTFNYMQHPLLPDSMTILPKTNEETGSRVYTTPTGLQHPSVSTVMGYDPSKEGSLEAWRKRVGEETARIISERATVRGNALHNCAEMYLSNNDPELFKEFKGADLITKSMFLKLKSKLDRYIGEVQGLEFSLYSDTMGIAGRTDCLAYFNGILSIVDFKNSKKKKKIEWIKGYILQATCYAKMVEDFIGIPVPQIVIPICNYDGSIDIFAGKTEDYVEKMQEQIDFYYRKHPEMVATPRST